MKKYIIIDHRMRKEEKEYFKSIGFEILEIVENTNLYSEISSHVDVHVCKINDELFVEPTVYEKFNNFNILHKGDEKILKDYPEDIKYNLCQIGNNLVHNFEYTDRSIKEYIKDKSFNLINVKQGYSNCSIFVLDENHVITKDIGIKDALEKKGIEVLLVDDTLDIKLLDGNKYSNMKGFIGGAMGLIEDTVIVFGDLEKIDVNNKIKNYINKCNLKIKDFKNQDVIDFGGIITFALHNVDY